jgi:hypothetical protein
VHPLGYFTTFTALGRDRRTVTMSCQDWNARKSLTLRPSTGCQKTQLRCRLLALGRRERFALSRGRDATIDPLPEHTAERPPACLGQEGEVPAFQRSRRQVLATGRLAALV